MDIIKELWCVAYNDNENFILITLSLSKFYKVTKEWAERNAKYLKDKDWFIVKYELAEDF